MCELLEYAENEFKLTKKQEDGATLRQHLEQLEKRGQHMPLLHINPPKKTGYIFIIYCELAKAKTSGGFGIPRLSFINLMDYQNFYNVKFDGFEIDALFKLDNVYIKELS